MKKMWIVLGLIMACVIAQAVEIDKIYMMGYTKDQIATYMPFFSEVNEGKLPNGDTYATFYEHSYGAVKFTFKKEKCYKIEVHTTVGIKDARYKEYQEALKYWLNNRPVNYARKDTAMLQLDREHDMFLLTIK
jgi:hypothetical protein